MASSQHTPHQLLATALAAAHSHARDGTATLLERAESTRNAIDAFEAHFKAICQSSDLSAAQKHTQFVNLKFAEVKELNTLVAALNALTTEHHHSVTLEGLKEQLVRVDIAGRSADSLQAAQIWDQNVAMQRG